MNLEGLRIEPGSRITSVSISGVLSFGEPNVEMGGIGIGIADVCPSVCLPNSMTQEKTKAW